MCRWIAYIGYPIYIENLVFATENSLIDQSLHCLEGKTRINGDGFGIGWYSERSEPGIFRDVLPAWNDENLRDIAKHVKSRLFFGHVRASTGTSTQRENCHPFASTHWMFMHNGQIPEYALLRRELEFALCDKRFQQLRGTTDSERIFYLSAQNELNQNPVEAICRTITDIERMRAKRQIKNPFRFTACYTDGKQIFACRYASDGLAPMVYWRELEQGLLVASEPLDKDRSNWHVLNEYAILHFDHSQNHPTVLHRF